MIFRRIPQLLLPGLLALTTCSPTGVQSLKPVGLPEQKILTVENGNLKAVFVDNDASGSVHKAGYNGIAALYHRQQDSTIFVPEYAGFNLEHVFGGDSLEQLFEPRRHPMKLFRIDDDKVALFQEATPLSRVESLTTFTVNAPHYIDIVFECVFTDDQFFRHGYAGLFWASYINKPSDKKIYFPGTSDEKKDPTWTAAYSEKHGINSTYLNVKDKHNFFFAENFNATLASHFSRYRYTSPYYYGKFGNMVLAFLFDAQEVIRFSQSPTGGGDDNPAWDFQYLIRSPKVGKKYSFRVRVVYKQFVSEMDVTEEYERWKKSN